MRNLKKVLALALVFALALGMMATAAFTDVEDIDMSDAVNTMTALGIINGYTDGSFRPDGIVTRAEMAKMIYVLKNGGKDDGASYYKNLSTPLTDISGHWAEGYIKYCYTLGIIAGMGDGTFRPQENVTGLQAAKMILTVLGYDAEKSGLVGLTWGVNTAALGAEKMLFEDFETALDQGLPRQEAALLMYNALDASVVKYDGEQYVVDTRIQSYTVENEVYTIENGVKKLTGYTTDTMTRTIEVDLGYALMKLDRVTGVMTAVGEAATTENGSVAEDAFRAGGTLYTEWEGDDLTHLIGCEVEVLFKDTDKVFGVFATEKNTVVNATFSKISKSDEKVKFSGTTYKLDSDFTVVSDYGQTGASVKATSAYFNEAKYADEVILVDNDNDGKLDYAFRNKVALGKVTYKGDDSVNISDKAGMAALTASKVFDLDDDIIGADDLAKNDYVKLTMDARTGKIAAEKVEVVEGSVGSTKTDAWKIGDTWYNQHADVDTKAESGDDLEYIAFGDIFYYTDEVSGASDVTDLLMLVNVQATTSVSSSGYEGQVIFSDGTKKNVNLDDGYSINGKTGNEKVSFEGMDDGELQAYVGKLYTYEINNDDEYQLRQVTDKFGDFDAYENDYMYDEDKDAMVKGENSIDVYEGATVFVFENSKNGDNLRNLGNKAKVITGKALNRASSVAATKPGELLTDKVNGFTYAVALTVHTNSYDFSSSTDKYAYLTADTTRVIENGKKYWEYTIWDGTSEKTVREEKDSTDVSSFKKGGAITYNEAGSMIDDVELIASKADLVASAVAITGYNNDDKMQLDKQGAAVSVKLDSDTQIIYIDSKNKKGVTGGEIALADEDADDHPMANAYVIDAEFASGKTLTVIFVEGKGSVIDGWKCKRGHSGVTVSFDSKGGTEVADKTADKNGKVTTPTDPTREGYIFDGWYLVSAPGVDDDKIDFTAQTFADDTTVYAKWIEQYTVTFKIAGETGAKSGVANIVLKTDKDGKIDTSKIVTTDIAADGYTFTKWIDKGGADATDFTGEYTANTTYTAVFTATSGS